MLTDTFVEPEHTRKGAECPACGSERALQRGSHLGYPIFRCSRCASTFFRRPIEYKNIYTEYYPYLKAFSKARLARERAARRGQAKAKLDVITRALGRRPRTLLDIGAGPGYLASLLSEFGVATDCAELNEDAREVAEKVFGLKIVSLEGAAERRYDAVTLFHVLEHIEDPSEMLAIARRQLVPDGLLMLHVPQSSTLSDTIDFKVRRLLGRKPERRGCLYLPDHLTGFTADGLNTLITRAGFYDVRIEPISKFHPEYDPALWIFNFGRPQFWMTEGLQTAFGLLNFMSSARGNWLRLTARNAGDNLT